MKVTISTPTSVQLGWELGDSNGQWTDACMYAVEHFGLPGGKYTTDLTSDWMKFSFQDPRDAMLFAMRWS